MIKTPDQPTNQPTPLTQYPTHPSSNYKAWEGLFTSSGIPKENVIPVETELSPEEGERSTGTRRSECPHGTRELFSPHTSCIAPKNGTVTPVTHAEIPRVFDPHSLLQT